MHSDMIKIGNIFRTAREAKSMTQEQLSRSTGITVRTIIDLEKSKRFPKFENLINIIRILDIPPEYILSSEKSGFTIELEQLMREIQSCDENERALFLKSAWAFVNTSKELRQPEKQKKDK
jgi:transcriptional regulator with XRE-family HTH domain